MSNSHETLVENYDNFLREQGKADRIVLAVDRFLDSISSPGGPQQQQETGYYSNDSKRVCPRVR